MAATRTRLGYVPALDGLRGLAVAVVIAQHAGLPLVRGAGSVGVGLFFALSGFLITTLLLEERAAAGRIDLGAFYLRRAARLLPALLLVLAVFAVVGSLLHAGRLWSSVLYSGLYLGNWGHIVWHGVAPTLGHTWSLAVEEHFYLVWPVVFLVAYRWGGPAMVLRAAAGLAALALVLRVALEAAGASAIRIQYGSDTRADSILIGCAAAVLVAQGRWRVPRAAPALAWAVVACFLVVPVKGLANLTVGLTVFTVAATVVVVDTTHADSPFARLLATRPLVALGKISYGVYLWHVPVLVLGRHHLHLPVPGPVKNALLVALAIGLAAVSYTYVERPILRWKARRTSRPVLALPASTDAGPAGGSRLTGDASSS